MTPGDSRGLEGGGLVTLAEGCWLARASLEIVWTRTFLLQPLGIWRVGCLFFFTRPDAPNVRRVAGPSAAIENGKQFLDR